MIDLSDMTEEQLRNLIANHERLGRTDAPNYRAAIAELQRRATTRFDLDCTTNTILTAATRRRFLSYRDVAEANGHDWSMEVRRQMPKHLDLVLSMSHAHGQPLITSIVVNMTNLSTGMLEPDSLNGFVAGAKRLGYQVNDPVEFLRQQQELTFDFARTREAGAV